MSATPAAPKRATAEGLQVSEVEDDSLVLYAAEDGVVTLTLNDGARMNPLADGLIDALESALQRARQAPDMRALILTARGRGFSVGADLADYRALLDASAATPRLGAHVGRLMARMQPLLLDLKAWPAPVICAINGVAAGGGVGLALAGDMVIAAESAYFYLPFLPVLGAVPDMGTTWLLPRALGAPRAMGLALTGDKLPAARAAQWGLIWDCVPDERLAAEARSLALRLAAMPAHSIGEARAAFAASAHQSLAQQLEWERARQMLLVESPSFAEGVRAFGERRAPRHR